MMVAVSSPDTSPYIDAVPGTLIGLLRYDLSTRGTGADATQEETATLHAVILNEAKNDMNNVD
jgi:hypothetical protein